MRLLVLHDEGPAFVERLREAVPELEVDVARSPAEAAERIADADAVYGPLTPALLAAARRLRWVQAPVAGLERFMFPELIHSSVTLTNMRGIYNDIVADHAFTLTLALVKGLPRAFRRQLERVWDSSLRPPHLGELTAGVLGLGGIGTELARRLKTVGMRVLAVDPRTEAAPEWVDALWRPTRLYELLAAVDVLVICAPETPVTRGLIDAEALGRMRRTAFLVNVGRGRIVRLDALTEALREGRIAGAALDVYETEPLPPDHPLWSLENVILTPHVAAAGAGGVVRERRWRVVIENARRFVRGEPLQNVVDKAAWF